MKFFFNKWEAYTTSNFVNQREARMCAALIGGMDRLKRDYMRAAKDGGVTLRCFNGSERGIADQLGTPDMLIIFTNMVSHEARKKALAVAKNRNIPLHMLHSCGVSSLRDCLEKNTRT